MTISIWRYSHLLLALVSSVFILIATVTGIILAFEPITEQLRAESVSELDELSIAETLPILLDQYDELVSIEVDENDLVFASVITEEGESGSFYIDPRTGVKIGEYQTKSPLFSFATNLHRSLFLKQTGRLFVGIASFLLFLIAVSGLVLIIKRQGGVSRFFDRIKEKNFNQRYHVVLGRGFLIPIVIITLSGVYLSLDRFEIIPPFTASHDVDYDNLLETPAINLSDFPLFQGVTLDDVRKIEFPFSPDVEDYFIIELKDREVLVNQLTGEVISEIKYPFSQLISYYSIILHTGKGSIWWSLVLLFSSFAILFFIYSGFSMTLTRRKNNRTVSNKWTKDEAEYIILVGSETGSTYSFAVTMYEALKEEGKSVFISELNEFSHYEQAKHLIIMTATYGAGDPPTNAIKFEQIFADSDHGQSLSYSVLGFGSLAYPDYCQYAITIDQLLDDHPSFNRALPLYKIHNQSFESFKKWVDRWSKATGIELMVSPPEKELEDRDEIEFTVSSKSVTNIDDTFMIRLKPNVKVDFSSGDLLSIIPSEDNIERLYSISKCTNDVLLSVKKHEYGVVSHFLENLNVGDKLKASINENNLFHLPEHDNEVVLVANGTGIAPFLGMVDSDKYQRCHLFWGCRHDESIEIYQPFLSNTKVKSLHVCHSRGEERKYVQDLIFEQSEMIIRAMKNNGSIMICGSITMQKGVMEILRLLLKENDMPPVDFYINEERILMDCY